jgi:hypothetical protein
LRDDREGAAAATKEFSYAAILSAVDADHHRETTRRCAYLASEVGAADSIGAAGATADVDGVPYRAPAAPVLSAAAVGALRRAARDHAGGDLREGARGIETVDLGALRGDPGAPAWEGELNAALTREIHPLVRSGWPGVAAEGGGLLTVTSATIFAGGGHPCAEATMTTFERDAGLFVVHIDLGNEGPTGEDAAVDDAAMGALYLEALVAGDAPPPRAALVRPLAPGRMAVHRSRERTAALVVPADLAAVGATAGPALDGPARRGIRRAAARFRHRALRLVLTTAGVPDGPGAAPAAPPEERAYRLRSYARLRAGARARHLTLAGLLAPGDYENHLWLGFDCLARADAEGPGAVDRAVFHLERAAALCPTDARVQFQLATALRAQGERAAGDEARGAGTGDQATIFARAAEALERARRLEGAAVRVGVHGIEDLTICLVSVASAVHREDYNATSPIASAH